MRLFYFFWLAIVLLCWPLSKIRYGYILIIILLFLFSGLRGENVDKDYVNYLEVFQSVNNFSDIFTDVISSVLVEKWFKGLAFAIKSIGFGLPMQMFLIAIVAVSLKIVFYKKLSPFFAVAIISYVSHFYLLQEMTQVRAGLAAAFFLIALWYFSSSKVKYYLFVIIATLIHSSFIVTIPIGFLLNNSIRRLYIFFGVALLSLFIGALNIPIAEVMLNYAIPLNEKIEDYILALQNDEINAINIYSFLMLSRIFLALLLLYFCMRKMIENSDIYIPFFQAYVIGISLFYFLSQSAALAFRFSEIFFVVEPILVSILIYEIWNRCEKLSLRFFLILFFILMSCALFMKTLDIMNPFEFSEIINEGLYGYHF